MVGLRPVYASAGLTGERRFRVQTRRLAHVLVVLQVSETIIVKEGGEVGKEIRRYAQWRDAQPEDLMNEQRESKCQTS